MRFTFPNSFRSGNFAAKEVSLQRKWKENQKQKRGKRNEKTNGKSFKGLSYESLITKSAR